MRRLGAGIAAAVVAATLGWAGSVEAQQRIVIYSSNDATLNKLVATEFTKATGIQADVISAGSGVVIKRVETEKDRPQGDIVSKRSARRSTRSRLNGAVRSMRSVWPSV